MNKSFSMAVGSDAYRDNYDRIFAKKPVEPLRGFEIDAAQYLADGMPVEEIERVRRARHAADYAWSRGDKAGSTDEHRNAERIRSAWYWRHRPDLAEKYGYERP